MRYFAECKTAEQLKKSYKNWAKMLHPDNQGNEEEFKAMQTEFSEMWEKLKDVHINAEGQTYTKETDETAGEFMEIIEVLIHLTDVQVELCGRWIWCSGNTREHKETLKELGFHWSRSKEAWYYHREPYRRRHNREYSLDEIRSLYGSQQYVEQAPEQETARLRIATV